MLLRTLLPALLIFLLLPVNSFATGPSSIRSEIYPISVNEQGEVLCRTRFTQNGMGSHKPMEVAYGFCILIQDSIIEYPTLTLSPEDYPDDDIFLEHCAYFDALFESPFDPAQISHMGPALNRYGFKEPNTASYRKDRILTLEEFEKEKNRELRTICQHALHGARGFFCEMDEQMHILYDFGHILLINNAMDTEEYDRYLGASFNYPNHWLPRPEGDTTEFGLYDKCAITGVLFIK